MKKRKKLNFIPSILLLNAFSEVAERKNRYGKERTAANYSSCINKVGLYLNEDAHMFSLQDITPEWVEELVRWLHEQHPGKPQTVDFYFRNVRAMSNHVLKSRKLRWNGGSNPFNGTVVKGIRYSKRALLKEELQSLLVPSLREKLPPVQKNVLDIFQFILYARGMVFQDVYNLTWDMISEDGHIRYMRSKTRVPIDVEISREAKQIMERHKRDGLPFVFPFLHENLRSGDYTLSEESSLRRINKYGVMIGETVGISIPLTTYVMRHTWATLMLEAGKPVELISQCLGHVSIETTQIYLSRISVNRVDSEVDDMVNQMLRPYTISEVPDDTLSGKKEREQKENILPETHDNIVRRKPKRSVSDEIKKKTPFPKK